jgi:hypothetical protein
MWQKKQQSLEATVAKKPQAPILSHKIAPRQ